MSRALGRARAALRQLDRVAPRETTRDRLVREVAERIVAEFAVGDIDTAIAAHPEFDSELALDVLLFARRLLHPQDDFMCTSSTVPSRLDLEIDQAIAATPDPRRVWL